MKKIQEATQTLRHKKAGDFPKTGLFLAKVGALGFREKG